MTTTARAVDVATAHITTTVKAVDVATTHMTATVKAIDVAKAHMTTTVKAVHVTQTQLQVRPVSTKTLSKIMKGFLRLGSQAHEKPAAALYED